MNKIVLTGRVTKNIEVRYTEQSVAIARFTLAVNREYKNQNGEYETDFISCIAYRQSAELLGNYVKKGDLIGIEGSIRTGSYEKDNQKIYTTDVFVERVEFLQSKQKEQKVEQLPKVETTDPYEEMGKQVAMGEYEIDESSLPF